MALKPASPLTWSRRFWRAARDQVPPGQGPKGGDARIHGPAVLAGEQDSEGTALWSKRPGCDHERGQEEVDENVKCVNAVV